jgi:hypothetical protein
MLLAEDGCHRIQVGNTIATFSRSTLHQSDGVWAKGEATSVLRPTQVIEQFSCIFDADVLRAAKSMAQATSGHSSNCQTGRQPADPIRNDPLYGCILTDMMVALLVLLPASFLYGTPIRRPNCETI